MAATRNCPGCDAPAASAVLFVEESIDQARINEFSFASRKAPEYMSHRMVRCERCDLVFADSPPAQEALAAAYHVAAYDSSEEASDAALAYERAIAPTLAKMARKESVLEIGTGTGVFLEHMSRQGFVNLTGVEPSSAAIAAAPMHRQAWIREAIFREQDFEPESYDLICCFMTMEHVRDPGELASAARRLLRSGGAFVTVTHDYRSLVNRVLGRRSPIIDIEHMQLFSRASARALFERCGFDDISVSSFRNRYALKYWLRLAPLPGLVKLPMTRWAASTGIDSLKMSANVGNILTAGFRRSTGQFHG